MSPSSTAIASRSSRTATECGSTAKSGSDWTKRLTLLAEALAAIPCQSAVIDAELVFPTSKGHPDFLALRAAIGGPQATSRARSVRFRSPATLIGAMRCCAESVPLE